MASMSDDYEDFWRAWCVRWVPRFAFVAVFIIVWLLLDGAWAASPWSGQPNVVGIKTDTVWLRPKLGPGGESARLVAGECHFDLVHVARTRADSDRIYHEQRNMDKGNMSCIEWMIGNGEQVP